MRILPVILISLAIFAATASPAYARLASQSFARLDFRDNVLTDAEIDASETSFSNPGLLPDHPLYFFKRLKEAAQLFFTFGAEEKARSHLDFAKTRLAEAKELAREGKHEKAKAAIEDFSKELEGFETASEGVGRNVSIIAKEDENFFQKSRLVLGLVLEKTPAQAKPGIENAFNNSIEKSIRAAVKNETRGEPETVIEEKVEKELERSKEIEQQIKEKAHESGKKAKIDKKKDKESDVNTGRDGDQNDSIVEKSKDITSVTTTAKPTAEITKKAGEEPEDIKKADANKIQAVVRNKEIERQIKEKAQERSGKKAKIDKKKDRESDVNTEKEDKKEKGK